MARLYKLMHNTEEQKSMHEGLFNIVELMR